MVLTKDELSILACPECYGDLEEKDNKLICKKCKETYDIVEGIPVLLPKDMAKDAQLSQEKWSELYKHKTIDADPNKNPYLKDSFAYIQEHVDVTKGWFLEVGCGNARNSFLLVKERGTKAVGLDFALGALIDAKRLFDKHNLHMLLVCGDMLHMPFKDNTFHAMFAGGAIEHFKDTQQSVDELARTLAKGGKLTSTQPFFSFAVVYSQLTGNIPDVPVLRPLAEWFHIKVLGGKHMMYGYEKSMTTAKLHHYMKKAGLKIVSYGEHKMYYEIKFAKAEWMKDLFRWVSHFKPFWPMTHIDVVKD